MLALHISTRDVIVLAYAALGVAGCFAALVFVEALNSSPENMGRIRAAAALTAVSMCAASRCHRWRVPNVNKA